MHKLSDQFRTPPWLFKLLDETFGPFFVDACCNKNNCLVSFQKEALQYYNEENYDYLASDMRKIYEKVGEIRGNMMLTTSPNIFMNPPYSNSIPFVQKAWEDAKYFRIVLLVRDDPSTNWYKEVINNATQHYNPPKDWNEFKLDCEKAAVTTLITKSTVIHLPRRIKFYASEEMMEADALKRPEKVIYYTSDSNVNAVRLADAPLKTKNYIRKEDGIECKDSYNFPICVIVLDRRHS